MSFRSSVDFPDASVTFTPQRLAEFALWESLHDTALALCRDSSPSVQSKLDMLHVLSDPTLRRDPVAGATAVRRAITAGDLSHARHLGAVLVALDGYAEAIGAHPAAPKAPAAKRGYALQNTDRDLGF